MPDHDPLCALLYRLNQNQNAIGAAVEELAIWIDQRGSTEVAERIHLYLETLTENSDAIAEALAELASKASQ